MPSLPSRFPRDVDRRVVWGVFAAIMIAAASAYAVKANRDGSAIVRWHPQVWAWFWQGRNIYDKEMFPNPPIFPLTLVPFVAMDRLPCAMAWFVFKVALATGSALLLFRMARESGAPMPGWAQGLALLLSLRPILSDLEHGNNNILIMSLIVAALAAWRKGLDVLAGLALALAISYKVTPALFVPYFLYKRSWRTVGATSLGMVLFLLVVPSAVLGFRFNAECLSMWFHRILSPFVIDSFASPQEINQSMVGVLTRLLTEAPKVVEPSRYVVTYDVNFVSWDMKTVVLLIKGLSVALVGLLALTCRTRTDRRDDPRLLGEFSLVVLTMLFVSERSWKHHFVTLILPYTYLACRLAMPEVGRRGRLAVWGALALSAFLMATTSDSIGGLFAHHKGHKFAQAYGMFLWSGVVLYVATAWRVVVEGRRDGGKAAGVPSPHVSPSSGKVVVG